MRIVIASSEVVPFSKTGGLADVVPALAKGLLARGDRATIITPCYPGACSKANLPQPADTSVCVTIDMGGRPVEAHVLRTTLPGSEVSVYLIDQPDYFDRPALYQEEGRDYKDNCERFCFFSRAVLETCKALDLQPNVIHANDWQTGLIPALLALEHGRSGPFQQTASVLTIHNLAFQGMFWHWDMLLTGLDWKYFNWRQMEFFGHLNLLKTAIVFADMITTVSPTYAREIQTDEFGFGLQGVLQSRNDDLVGILNGIDPEVWNPANDGTLACRYTVDNVTEGKKNCKASLQSRLGLPVRPDVPLFGMISRMTDQKGFDLIMGCITDILSMDVQLCFLGTGEERYEHRLRELNLQYPEKVAATIGFDERLAHQIEAGSDIFLMPSRFEPCGLNQMYSQAYGTVPIVKRVGGLADSVVDLEHLTLEDGTATGFVFDEYSSESLFEQVTRAVNTYHNREQWQQLVTNGMRKDFSWTGSAEKYADVYRRAVQRCLQRLNEERELTAG